MGEIDKRLPRVPEQQPVKSEPSPLILSVMTWIVHSLLMFVLLIAIDISVKERICAALILGWFSFLLADKK